MLYAQKQAAQRQIFLLFTCDADGKGEKLLAAATKRSRLKKACVRAIHNDLLEYAPEGYEKKNMQVRRFRRDFERLEPEDVSKGLRYGFLRTCMDGEEIYDNGVF